MLHELLTSHRAAIVERACAMIAVRSAPRAAEPALRDDLGRFVDQLAEVLRREGDATAPAAGPAPACRSTTHVGALRRAGFSIGDLVHEYGDVCQAVTGLAIDLQARVTVTEFRTLNRCLDEAIADAVTEFDRQRERTLAARGTEHLGAFAHRLGDLVSDALFAYDVLLTGAVGVGGSMGAVLAHSLRELRDLIDEEVEAARRDQRRILKSAPPIR